MDPNTAYWLGWGGAILGSALGIAGGVLGTWASIWNTQTPAERAFMVRCAIGTWLAVAVFVAAMVWVPAPYKWFLWIPYLVAMLVAIPWMNRVQARLRGTMPPLEAP
jgi:hypothetical protein